MCLFVVDRWIYCGRSNSWGSFCVEYKWIDWLCHSCRGLDLVKVHRGKGDRNGASVANCIRLDNICFMRWTINSSQLLLLIVHFVKTTIYTHRDIGLVRAYNASAPYRHLTYKKFAITHYNITPSCIQWMCVFTMGARMANEHREACARVCQPSNHNIRVYNVIINRRYRERRIRIGLSSLPGHPRSKQFDLGRRKRARACH